jgi:hypothetical protein
MKSPILLRVPAFPQVAGVFVHGCVVRGAGSSFRASAHAHNDSKDEAFGWICIRSSLKVGRFVIETDGNGFDGKVLEPSETLLHEIAHILSPDHGHDDAWRAKMAELGQKVEGTKYEKRRRSPIDRRANWAEIFKRRQS